VIDAEVQAGLQAHIDKLKSAGKLLAEVSLPAGLEGHFVAPVAFEIDAIGELEKEHFWPILHLVRFAASELDAVVGAINATGYGLTLGVHSRNEQTARRIEQLARVGNLYVNRNQIGAVVGVQPFGACGLRVAGCRAPGQKPVGRVTCCALPMSALPRSTPPQWAATPRCCRWAMPSKAV
jgi:RHH-type proline utilization regulon transcriptional repressor/proline dehydrogenase/delta 1-pyrroline-5-carboxylate dehydrogenase